MNIFPLLLSTDSVSRLGLVQTRMLMMFISRLVGTGTQLPRPKSSMPQNVVRL